MLTRAVDMRAVPLVALLAALAALVPGAPVSHAASPHAQFEAGVPIGQIKCGEDLVLLESPHGRPVCVTEGSAARLMQRGFEEVAPAAAGRDAGVSGAEPKIPPVRVDPEPPAREPDVIGEPGRILEGLLGRFDRSGWGILADNIVSYSVDALPPVDDPALVRTALEDGIDAWELANPGLVFAESDDPEVVIRWELEPGPAWIGQADCDYITAIISCELTISVGGTSCSGRYEQAYPWALTNTIMHEIGHVLDIGHTSDESHLMHGDDNPPPSDPLDLMGFNVPDALESQLDAVSAALRANLTGLEIEQVGLNRTLDGLNLELEELNRELDRIEGLKRLLGYPNAYDPDLEEDIRMYNMKNDDYKARADDYNLLIEDYNRRIGIYNQQVDELDVLVERANAYSTDPCHHERAG